MTTYRTLIACSNRRHGQDKTVLSCIVRVGGVNTIADKTGQFCLVLTQFRWILSRLDPVSNFQVFSSPQYIWDWTVANWKLSRDKTKLPCLVASCVHTTDTDKTRQFCLVLSVSAVRTSYNGIVSDATYRRKIRFLTELEQSDNLLCKLFVTKIADEVTIVQQSHCLWLLVIIMCSFVVLVRPPDIVCRRTYILPVFLSSFFFLSFFLLFFAA